MAGALEGVDELSASMRATAWMSGRSLARPTPAAAIIWGLKGLEEELARLPFRECCMP